MNSSTECRMSRGELHKILVESGVGQNKRFFEAYFDVDSHPPTCCVCHKPIGSHTEQSDMKLKDKPDGILCPLPHSLPEELVLVQAGEIKKHLEEFRATPDMRYASFVVKGPSGTGKTTFATHVIPAVAREVLETKVTALRFMVTTAPEANVEEIVDFVAKQVNQVQSDAKHCVLVVFDECHLNVALCRELCITIRSRKICEDLLLAFVGYQAFQPSGLSAFNLQKILLGDPTSALELIKRRTKLTPENCKWYNVQVLLRRIGGNMHAAAFFCKRFLAGSFDEVPTNTNLEDLQREMVTSLANRNGIRNLATEDEKLSVCRNVLHATNRRTAHASASFEGTGMVHVDNQKRCTVEGLYFQFCAEAVGLQIPFKFVTDWPDLESIGMKCLVSRLESFREHSNLELKTFLRLDEVTAYNLTDDQTKLKLNYSSPCRHIKAGEDYGRLSRGNTRIREERNNQYYPINDNEICLAVTNKDKGEHSDGVVVGSNFVLHVQFKHDAVTALAGTDSAVSRGIKLNLIQEEYEKAGMVEKKRGTAATTILSNGGKRQVFFLFITTKPVDDGIRGLCRQLPERCIVIDQSSIGDALAPFSHALATRMNTPSPASVAAHQASAKAVQTPVDAEDQLPPPNNKKPGPKNKKPLPKGQTGRKRVAKKEAGGGDDCDADAYGGADADMPPRGIDDI